MLWECMKRSKWVKQGANTRRGGGVTINFASSPVPSRVRYTPHSRRRARRITYDTFFATSKICGIRVYVVICVILFAVHACNKKAV